VVAFDHRLLADIGQDGRREFGELSRRLEGRADQPDRRAEHDDQAAHQPDPCDDVGPVPGATAAPPGEEVDNAAHSRAVFRSPRRPSWSWISVSTTSTSPIRIDAAAARPGLRKSEANPIS